LTGFTKVEQQNVLSYLGIVYTKVEL